VTRGARFAVAGAALAYGLASAPACADPASAASPSPYAQGIVYDEVRRIVSGAAPEPTDAFDADESAALRVASAAKPSSREARMGAAAAGGAARMAMGMLGGIGGMFASALMSAAAHGRMTAELASIATVHRHVVLPNGWSRDDDLGAQTAVIVKDGHATRLDLRAKTYAKLDDAQSASDDLGTLPPDAQRTGSARLGGLDVTRYHATIGIGSEDAYLAHVGSPASHDGTFVLYQTVTATMQDRVISVVIERGKLAPAAAADRGVFDVPSDFVAK